MLTTGTAGVPGLPVDAEVEAVAGLLGRHHLSNARFLQKWQTLGQHVVVLDTVSNA